MGLALTISLTLPTTVYSQNGGDTGQTTPRACSVLARLLTWPEKENKDESDRADEKEKEEPLDAKTAPSATARWRRPARRPARPRPSPSATSTIPGSQVSQWKSLEIHYALLAELNTRPRTTYLAALRNPNREIKE